MSEIILEAKYPSTQEDCTCSTAAAIYNTGADTCSNLFHLAQSHTENKEDILRSVLLFACSTIDSVGKQLSKDCLKELIDSDEGAQETFQTFIEREIKKDSAKILPRALSRPDYRNELINVLKESIEGKSLQSYSQISELTARFGIPTDKIITQKEAERIFDARQKIVHEMDINAIASQGNSTQRHVRAEGEIKTLIENMMSASCALIQTVHDKIHEPRATLSEE